MIELPADESLPEGVFVEDTAVACDGVALICRPGLPGRLREVQNRWAEVVEHRSRSAQVDIIRTILKREGLATVDIEDPLATIDGSDVLFTGSSSSRHLTRQAHVFLQAENSSSVYLKPPIWLELKQWHRRFPSIQ